ncbi:MAG: type I-C CRISPR-associated endonuclease Cas1c [Planctomycetota bacterium]
MKRHLNTLFVTTDGAYLAAVGETVAVKIEGETKLRVPLHLLQGIVCFGRVSASPQLMSRCAERDVGLSFLSSHGRFQARVQGPISGNVLLRRAQFRLADCPTFSASISKVIVTAKIVNCRSILRRRLRDHPDATGSSAIQTAVDELAKRVSSLDRKLSLDSIRGVEGDAARIYFSVFDHLIVQQKQEFKFQERSRRPPRNAVNAVLSFGYSLLAQDVSSALQAVGLDPQVGYLHRDRPGRPSFALDLMEELRPIMVDRVALSLINRRQIKITGFKVEEAGGIHMDDKTRKKLLIAYQERKDEVLVHPFLGEKISSGLISHIQARLAARYIRGELDAYPAYFHRG